MVSFRRLLAGRHYAGWFLLNALLFASRTASQDFDKHSAVFIYPTKEEIFYQYDQVRVTYTSEIPSPTLHVWCRSSDPNDVHESFKADVPGPNGSYTVTIDFTAEKPCWFNLKSGNDSDTLGQNSVAFNVIGQTRSTGPQTFGPESQNTPTSSDTTKSTTSSSTSPNNVPTNIINNNDGNDSNNQTNQEPKSSGLSTGATAGIAVGAALGSLAIAAGLFAYIWKRRKSGKEGMQSAKEEMPPPPPPPPPHQEQQELEAPKYTFYASDQSAVGGGGEGRTGHVQKQGYTGHGTHELATTNHPAEMPS